MALTQTAEYALRAVIWLAQHRGQPQTKTEIATATQVPSAYLPKVFQPLVRGGLISGQRGIGGGYSLVREPDELTLLEVVNQVDPIQRIERCPLDLESHGTKLCPLHTLLAQAIVAEEKRLRETTVAEVIGEPGQITPLCEVADRLSRCAQEQSEPAALAASPSSTASGPQAGTADATNPAPSST